MTNGTGPSDEFEEILGDSFTAPQDLEAGELWFKWELRSLENAYRERPPRRYVVEELLSVPSLSVVYGGPGSLKSMLLADLCICVADGRKWLEPVPNTNRPGVSFATNQAAFLWIDLDNGTDRSDERFEALGRAYDIPANHPNIHYVSMPAPWLDTSSRTMVEELAKFIKRLDAKLVIIDNLGVSMGETEENSGKMAQVMGALRWLCEETQSAVIVVHHQRKSGGQGDKGIRKGESLRGHSSIEAALDLALLIERKDRSDTITVVPTKVRGYLQHEFFGALFTYEHKSDSKELAKARFFAQEALTLEQAAILKIRNTIVNVLIAEGAMLQKDLMDRVRDTLAAEPGGTAPGLNKVRGIIKQMVDDDVIVEEGSGNRRLYRRI